MEEIQIKPAPPTEEINTTPINEEEFTHLKPGKYTLHKSQVHVDGRTFHTRKKIGVEVHVLIENDPLLVEHGMKDPVAQTDYKPGETVIVTTYEDGDGQRTSMLREDSFFLINNRLQEHHFIPAEEQ